MPETGIARPLRLAIVEDEALFLDLLGDVLSRMDGLEVVGSYRDPDEAGRAIPLAVPDAVLLDIDLGMGRSGFDLGLQLRERMPDLAIVLLSNYADRHFLTTLTPQELAGWSYLLKKSVRGVEDLRRAIEGATQGLTMVDSRLVGSGEPDGRQLPQLSSRQLDLLRLLAQGYSNAAIGDRLGLAEKSVQNQLSALYANLEIGTTDLAVNPRVLAAMTYIQAGCP